jgi:hypothetical protein
MNYNTPTPAPSADDQTETLRYAERLLHACRWTEARTILHRLATTTPGVTRYRVLLAYARGEEYCERGELARARAEWRRALILDPSCIEAKAALGRVRRGTFFGRIVGMLSGRA